MYIQTYVCVYVRCDDDDDDDEVYDYAAAVRLNVHFSLSKRI